SASGPNDGFASQDRCVWINRDPVLHVRVSFATFLDLSFLILLKATSPEGDSVVELYVRADAGSFTDHYSRTVVDKERPSDARTGVDVDPGPAVCPFSHDTWN